jgi:hypothetical protein
MRPLDFRVVEGTTCEQNVTGTWAVNRSFEVVLNLLRKVVKARGFGPPSPKLLGGSEPFNFLARRIAVAETSRARFDVSPCPSSPDA